MYKKRWLGAHNAMIRKMRCHKARFIGMPSATRMLSKDYANLKAAVVVD
jgi:hypothetical protein